MATCVSIKKFGFINFRAHLGICNNGADNIRSKTGAVLAIIAKGNIIEGIEARY